MMTPNWMWGSVGYCGVRHLEYASFGAVDSSFLKIFFSHFARCPNPVAELLRIGDYQELQHALAVIQQHSMKQVRLIKMAA
ncbi:hypothetical protein [Comamonas testosteroni]|uniref:hypothetical protein n=1 Tax=Comamonas testosteroni TaxID=285 RepID=UPI0026F1C52C|nr:hypothetical protein [Comamonas testosteroni]WQD42399.1 hypothetical protein U0024_22175 [Comamonas testosteroni]